MPHTPDLVPHLLSGTVASFRPLLIVAIVVWLATDTPAIAQPPAPSGLMYEISRGAKPVRGCPKRNPNSQTADVAVIEFSMDGSFKNREQLKDAVSCIEFQREDNKPGAIVVLFIHGWHHNASWDHGATEGSGAEGDSTFAEFRRVLLSLALREAERYDADGEAGRRVIGIYLGWPGKVNDESWLKHFSFWSKYDAARGIGEGSAIEETILRVIRATKGELQGGAWAVESPLTMMGHSNGALMLETAFMSILERDSLDALRTARSTGCGSVTSHDEPILFPDVVMLLNSTADFEITGKIIASAREKELEKLVTCGKLHRAPLLISVASESDKATRFLFVLGKWKKTSANTKRALTHKLQRETEGALCTARKLAHQAKDYDQSWHCLRRPKIEGDLLTTMSVDLPQESLPRAPCHVRYTLGRMAGVEYLPFWVFKVPDGVMSSHGDIFNERSRSFLMALMQMSGATMSLARDYEDTYEDEEQLCTPAGFHRAPDGVGPNG